VEDPMVPVEPKDERGGSKPYVSYSLWTAILWSTRKPRKRRMEVGNGSPFILREADSS